MIAGIFHEGSGLGNQLHRYVAARLLATEKGCQFGMVNPRGFKGKHFLDLDMGVDGGTWQPAPGGRVVPDLPLKLYEEKRVLENGVDIRGFDPEYFFVEDDTIIDGEFQDWRYFGNRLDQVREWLAVEPLPKDDDVCVIGFRGGEFTGIPELFLPKSYWDTAIAMMLQENPNMRFEVHTDDEYTARAFFPEFPIIHNVEENWRSVRYARYLIIANSSFYIFPSLLNQCAQIVIAPRYWARRNTKVWALPQNYYSRFTYI